MSHPDQLWPEAYGVQSNAIYPIYFILKELLKYKNQKVGRLISAAPLKSDGLVFIEPDGRETIFVANYTAADLTIHIEDLSRYDHFILNESNFGDVVNGSGKVVFQRKQSDEPFAISRFGIAILKGS